MCVCQCACGRNLHEQSALSSTIAAVLMHCVIVIDCVSGMFYKRVHGNPAEVQTRREQLCWNSQSTQKYCKWRENEIQCEEKNPVVWSQVILNKNINVAELDTRHVCELTVGASLHMLQCSISTVTAEAFQGLQRDSMLHKDRHHQRNARKSIYSLFVVFAQHSPGVYR